MDFASLRDAFPTGDQVKPKKKKRNACGAPVYDMPPLDPDRQAYQRMQDSPPPMRPSTDGIPNDFLDASQQFQAKPTVMNSLPSPRSLLKRDSDSASFPKFFGAEPFVNPSEDSMATYSPIDSAKAYMLEADFAKSFDQRGVERAEGVNLPVPELRHRWKSLSGGGVESAFYDQAPQRKSSQFSGMATEEFNAMKSKIDDLMARLDDIENRQFGTNPQMEMLTFIMTGLFLMFGLDVAVRKSAGMRLLNIS